MTSSPRRHRRHNSIDDPPSLSDVINLKDELNRLHEEISPECMEHINKLSDHVDEFENDYRRATRLTIGAAVTGTAAAGLALFVFTGGLSLIVSGLAAVAYITAAIVGFQKQYKEKDFRKTLETELEEFGKKISPIIDMIEKIFNRIEDILQDPTLSENKANAIRERFSYVFEKMQLFQGQDDTEGGDQTSKTSQFSGTLSDTVAEISSVLDDLEDILEGEVTESSDRPAEAPRPKQMDDKEFKIKTEKFIDDMKKGIDHLKNVMNEVTQMKERISRNLKTD